MHLAKFCLRCAGELVERVPVGDDRSRRICVHCGYVAYVNPKIATGTLPVRDGKVALIRRAVEPAVGRWSWPAGYLEADETVEDAARRETREETGLEVTLGPMLGLYSFPANRPETILPGVGLVVVAWATTAVSGTLRAGDDADEAAWFDLDDLPWERLAFASSRMGLADLLTRLAE